MESRYVAGCCTPGVHGGIFCDDHETMSPLNGCIPQHINIHVVWWVHHLFNQPYSYMSPVMCVAVNAAWAFPGETGPNVSSLHTGHQPQIKIIMPPKSRLVTRWFQWTYSYEHGQRVIDRIVGNSRTVLSLRAHPRMNDKFSIDAKQGPYSSPLTIFDLL